jgi:hypothetical protein
MTRFIAPILLIVGLGLCGYSLKLLYWAPQKPEDLISPLKTLWEKDVKKLKQDKGFLRVWNSIREVEIKPGDDLAKIYLPQALPKIPKNPQGQYLLEIMLLGWEDERDSGAIVLYHFIDIETGNLLWELGRTFRFPAIDKKQDKKVKPQNSLRHFLKNLLKNIP